MATEDEFGGTIDRSYEDSEEWWPEPLRAHPDAPNVIIFLLDDVGFGQLSQSFGGLIDTPNLDRLAENGLRFNDFHTTALCSPTRGSLMTGRNPHTIGLGSHSLTAMGFPGYNAMVPSSCKTGANYLGEAGYVNYALGKWDHTPLYEVSQRRETCRPTLQPVCSIETLSRMPSLGRQSTALHLGRDHHLRQLHPSEEH